MTKLQSYVYYRIIEWQHKHAGFKNIMLSIDNPVAESNIQPACSALNVSGLMNRLNIDYVSKYETSKTISRFLPIVPVTVAM